MAAMPRLELEKPIDAASSGLAKYQTTTASSRVPGDDH
jgi:hypothetical protein